MRPSAPALSLAALLCVVAASGIPAPPEALAGELRIRVRDQRHVPKGPIPAKRPVGQADTVAVVGEAVGETEFRAADEMASAVSSGQEGGPNGEVALRVLAVPGKGGLQNLRDVLERADVDFGIAPAPLLEAAAGMPAMANLRDRIAYVSPLYVEEVHVLAGPSVSTAADLAGKRVAVGEVGGSTEFLSREVFRRLGVPVVEVNMGTAAAASAVRAGTLDAFVVVSGKPVDSLRGATAGGGLHLVPLPSDTVPDGFVPSALSRDDYPGLVPEGPPVPTYGVQTVLFGYDWPVRSARGRVGQTFLAILLYRLPDLQVGTRHPKWREVNVAATVPGWRRLPAMEAWLAKARPRSTGPIGEAEFEGFLRRTGTKVTGENRDALYQDFVRWRSTPVAGAGR